MKYIVKVNAIATDDNPNFKGETHTYYIARDLTYGNMMYAKNNAWIRKNTAKKWIEYNIEWNKKHELYWTKTYELIELQ